MKTIMKKQYTKNNGILSYFSLFERLLWLTSVLVILFSFFCSKNFYPLTLIASLIGVTSLIFIAKGNPIGQILMIAFSALYSIVSVRFAYYGEMITYAFMTAPSAAVALISWLRHPSKKGKSEVEVATMSALKWIFLFISCIIVTIIFYFILRYFHTENLIVSAFSVTTSFLASMLVILRSPFYALAYAANDVILIGLWIFAAIYNPSYLPMIFCFLAFLCNDVYGYVSWIKMQKRQKHS